MSRIIFILVFICLSVNAYCQSNNTLELKAIDFEKYINNFDSFRIVMLEQGFKLNRKDSTEKEASEHWDICESRILESGKVQSYTIVGVQISTWYFKEFTQKFICLSFLNGNKYQDFINQLKSDVKMNFPIKRVVSFKRSENGGEKKDCYKLVYSKMNSNIEVEIEEEDLDTQNRMFTFSFTLDI